MLFSLARKRLVVDFLPITGFRTIPTHTLSSVFLSMHPGALPRSNPMAADHEEQLQKTSNGGFVYDFAGVYGFDEWSCPCRSPLLEREAAPGWTSTNAITLGIALRQVDPFRPPNTALYSLALPVRFARAGRRQWRPRTSRPLRTSETLGHTWCRAGRR
jgi:hypothetical protein